MCTANFAVGATKVADKKSLSSYVHNAVHRAYCIFDELFNSDDPIFIVVDSHDEREDTLVRSLMGNIIDECKYPFCSKDREWTCERYILESRVENVNIRQLLEEITWSDIDGKRNSYPTLRVFFLNQRNHIIYYLYDDRVLDIVSPNKAILKGVYDKFNDWILGYDRERIDKIFT